MNGKYGNGPTTPQDYEKVYAVWTSDALGAGNMQFKTLIEKYESFEAIYKLGEAQYIECGIKRGSVPMRRLLNKSLDNAIKVFDFCTHYFFGILLYTSEHYPKRLKGISNPPPVLYVRGKWVDFNSNVCIAVVGTRSYSEQGWKSTYMISEGLARCGAVRGDGTCKRNRYRRNKRIPCGRRHDGRCSRYGNRKDIPVGE